VEKDMVLLIFNRIRRYTIFHDYIQKISDKISGNKLLSYWGENIKENYTFFLMVHKEFHKMAQTFGMAAEYGQSNNKAEKATVTTTKQPEENRAEPEAKKLRVQAPDMNKSTTNESGTPTT
jgi:hypothetical protein